MTNLSINQIVILMLNYLYNILLSLQLIKISKKILNKFNLSNSKTIKFEAKLFIYSNKNKLVLYSSLSISYANYLIIKETSLNRTIMLNVFLILCLLSQFYKIILTEINQILSELFIIRFFENEKN